MKREAKRLRVVVGYAALARFHAELGEAPAGYVPRHPEIPSPYAYSPVHPVWDWQGRKVFVVETRHRRYEVFEVAPEEVLTEAAAEAEALRQMKAAREAAEVEA